MRATARTLRDVLEPHRRAVGWVALVVSLLAGFVADYPWGDWVGHTHWAKVGWIPFYSWPVRPFDILQNLLLFSPVGVASALAVRRRPALVAALLTLPVAFAGEATQLYSHGRFPSSTDLVNNVAGAALAAYVCARYFSWDR
jgi:glycopeptide antibiotics resistance protein